MNPNDRYEKLKRHRDAEAAAARRAEVAAARARLAQGLMDLLTSDPKIEIEFRHAGALEDCYAVKVGGESYTMVKSSYERLAELLVEELMKEYGFDD